MRKAPCCRFKCPSSKQASKPFLPGTEDEDPTTSKYGFWGFNLAPPCRVQSVMVSHGKSASKLERMKHIRRTHERFPYFMAALQMLASCIVQSFTKCRTKTSKNKSSTLIYQLCSVSPPVNFFAAHSGYDLSWATCWCWTCTVSCRWSWTMYCFAVYHYLLLRAYQANSSDIGIQSA